MHFRSSLKHHNNGRPLRFSGIRIFTAAAAAFAVSIASVTSLPPASATPIRRFFSVFGLQKRRRSTGAPGWPRPRASPIPSNPKSSLSRSAEDHRRCARPGQLDRRDGQAEHGAQVQLELVRELRDEGDHARIVRARRQFREDRLVAADEEFDAENAVAAERLDHLAGLPPGGKHCAVGNTGRLPAFAIIACFLTMADRRAEQDSALRCDRQQGDLAVELDELLDDDARPVAAHVRDGIIPRGADFLLRLRSRLALAGARHDRLHDARAGRPRRPRRWLRRGIRRTCSAT